MRHVRITPLNLVTTVGLVFLILTIFEKGKSAGIEAKTIGIFVQVLLGGLIVVSFVCDLIFRFIFKELKKIWFIEIAMIVIVAVLFLLLKN